jgi:fibronectin-binding autotransporter adhesin
VFDVAPANAGVGHWLIQPSGQNLVLLNSVNSPPGGTATVTVGAVNGTNVVRNTVITLSATITGPNIQNVSVDLSGFGGSVTPLTLQGGAWTGQVTIPAGTPPGSIGLPIIAYDGTLYGEITLALNVLTTTDTWNGAHFNINQNTDDNANWVSAAAPGYVGDSLVFAGNTGLTPLFNHNYTFNGIDFASGAGSFILGTSGGSVTVTGGVTNDSANVETLDIPLTISGAVFNGAAGNLVLSNTLTGSGLLNIAAGAGGVTLSGIDNHLGNTTIASGGSLTLGSNAVWYDIGFNLSYSGNMTNNGTFTYNSTFDQSIAGVISGTGNVIVNGPGPLTLRGNNSFTGNLTINATTVHDTVAQNANAPTVGGLGNPQTAAKTNTINNGGVLLLEAAGGNEFGNGSTTPTMKFVVNQGGMIQITSGNATMGPLTMNGGTLSIAVGTSAQFEPYELQSLTVGGTSPSYISPTNGLTGPNSGINLTINAAANAQMPINVASTGSGGPDLLISAVMVNSGNSQNAAGFVKTGNGVMEMSAINIFSGPITVGAGAVLLDGDSQIRSGIYSNNIVISNGAAFIFASTQSQTNLGPLSGSGTLVVSNTVGTGLVLGGTNTFTGTVAIKTGTLGLVPGGSLSNATVAISGGGTLDLTQMPTPYLWPAASTLSGSGSAASAAVINSAGSVSLSASTPVILTYNSTGGGAALNVSGNLSLGGNAFTVNTVNGLPLANGTYVLVQVSGGITSAGSYPAVTGTAIGAGTQGAISVVGSQVILTVSTATVLPPASVTFSRSGSTLTLSWPSDHLGYILQSNSVNLTNAATWFNVPGSSSVTNFPVTFAPGSNVFFRLVSP